MSMYTNALQCDGCKRFERIEQAVTWLQMERTEIRNLSEPDRWFFCSWDCLGTYAAGKMARMAEAS